MKFFHTLKKEQRLLLRNSAFAVLFIFIFFGCGGEEKDPLAPRTKFDFNDSEQLTEYMKKKIDSEYSTALYAYFTSDSIKKVFAGKEILTPENWGIQFDLFNREKDTLIKIYESPLLEGSFQGCSIAPITLPGYKYDLLFYNSSDFFLGSGGGEVFVYLIDFQIKEVYYAHLIVMPDMPVSLYYSPNFKSEAMKNFIYDQFKSDYESIQIITKDKKFDI